MKEDAVASLAFCWRQRRPAAQVFRPSRSAWSSRSSPAARPTSSDAPSRRSSRKSSASPAWSRTTPAPTAPSPPSSSPRRTPTATPSWSARSACSRSTRRCSRTCATTRCAISRRSRSPSPRRTCSSPSPTLAAGSLKELVEYAKKNPGQALLLLERHRLVGPPDGRAPQAGCRHLRGARPLQGGAACQTDIMGGQVDISFQNLGAVTNYIAATA